MDCLSKIKIETQERFISLFEIEDKDSQEEEVKKILSILSLHLAPFMACTCFEVLTDPESWLKHTFYESLKNIQHLRKETIESINQETENNAQVH